MWFQQHQPRTVSGILGLLVGPPTLLVGALHDGRHGVIRTLLSWNALYLFSLISSVVLYRLSPFHPLAKYPGPTLAKVSRLFAFRMAASGNQHRYYHQLHQQYGPVVRTGGCIIKSGL